MSSRNDDAYSESSTLNTWKENVTSTNLVDLNYIRGMKVSFYQIFTFGGEWEVTG